MPIRAPDDDDVTDSGAGSACGRAQAQRGRVLASSNGGNHTSEFRALVAAVDDEPMRVIA
jgi:hypothetical protein